MTDKRDVPTRFTEFPTTTAAVRSVQQAGAEGGNALPAGYQIHEFQIAQVIGEGGFGIVYLAHDLQLQRTVALKEYMPSSLAARGGDHLVSLRSERHRETFELGLRSFVNEARLLASFDHPSLVKVYRFWEQNGTAYMVMPYYEGPTLKALLKQTPHPPDEAWLKALLRPLLDALQIIHNDHCYHRDIAPDNILLLGSQLKPLLLDFGAARRVIGDATQALTVILKPGYAPVEQYAEVPSMKQGPWTDVYALCAVLYAAITGRAPVASVGRLMKDDMVPVAQSAHGKYSDAFLSAIDHGLAVRPEHRPQDINALRASLFADDLPEQGDDVTQIRTTTRAEPMFTDSGRAPLPSGFGGLSTRPTDLRPATPAPAPAPTASSSSRSLLIGGAVFGLLAAAGVAWFLTRTPSPAATTAKPLEATAPVPAVAAAASSATPSAPEPVAPRGPFGTVAALEDIVRHSDPLISVNTLADKQTIVIGREKMQFRFKASEAGYLYVFHSGTDGAHLSLLFPNGIDSNNRIAADTEVVLPRKSWQITADGPAGVNHIVTMMSRVPRDFSAIGLKPGGPIREFDLDTLQRLWATAPANGTPFAGTAQCADTANCDAGFGATLIRIAEVAASR